MNSGLEKLEGFYEQSKNDPAAIGLFYNEVWDSGTLIAPGVISLVEKMDVLIKSKRPVDAKNLAISKLGFSWVCYHEGKYEESLKISEEIKKSFSDINEEGWVQCVAVMFGSNYRTLGELELALKYFYDAYRFLSKSNIHTHQVFLSFCVYMIAEIHSDTGQYDDALEYHAIGERLTTDCGFKHMLCRTWLGIGAVYQHQKKYGLAFDYLDRAVKLSGEINNQTIKSRALTDIGSYYFEMGDYAKAGSCQEEALQIRTELNAPNAAVTNLINLGQLEIKQNKLDEAIDILNKGLRIAEEVKVKPKMFQIHQMLSDIYQSKGDLIQSLFHYKAYHMIREDVQHEDNEKKMKSLKMVFAAEQTQKENVIIKKQKAEIQKKNIELQDTIDELTLSKINRKAKVITLAMAVILFIFEDPIVGFALNLVSNHSPYLSLMVKIVVIFSLSPLNAIIQKYLLKKVVKKKKREEEIEEEEVGIAA